MRSSVRRVSGFLVIEAPRARNDELEEFLESEEHLQPSRSDLDPGLAAALRDLERRVWETPPDDL